MYEYQDIGIERMLSDIYRLYEEELYKGDVSAATIRIDLEMALQSRALTPRQRQCVALYYFAQLTQEEAADVLQMSQPAVHARLTNAVVSLAAQMRGETVRASQLTLVDLDRNDTAINRWLADAAANEAQWWRVPDDVWAELQARFGVEPACEAADAGGAEYPWLTDRQLKWKRYKEFPRPEIYPRNENVGARKGVEGGKLFVVRTAI